MSEPFFLACASVLSGLRGCPKPTTNITSCVVNRQFVILPLPSPNRVCVREQRVGTPWQLRPGSEQPGTGLWDGREGAPERARRAAPASNGGVSAPLLQPAFGSLTPRDAATPPLMEDGREQGSRDSRVAASVGWRRRGRRRPLARHWGSAFHRTPPVHRRRANLPGTPGHASLHFELSCVPTFVSNLEIRSIWGAFIVVVESERRQKLLFPKLIFLFSVSFSTSAWLLLHV